MNRMPFSVEGRFVSSSHVEFTLPAIAAPGDLDFDVTFESLDGSTVQKKLPRLHRALRVAPIPRLQTILPTVLPSVGASKVTLCGQNIACSEFLTVRLIDRSLRVIDVPARAVGGADEELTTQVTFLLPIDPAHDIDEAGSQPAVLLQPGLITVKLSLNGRDFLEPGLTFSIYDVPLFLSAVPLLAPCGSHYPIVFSTRWVQCTNTVSVKFQGQSGKVEIVEGTAVAREEDLATRHMEVRCMSPEWDMREDVSVSVAFDGITFLDELFPLSQIGFVFYDKPVPQRVEPSVGRNTGADQVTISGAHFVQAAIKEQLKVRFSLGGVSEVVEGWIEDWIDLPAEREVATAEAYSAALEALSVSLGGQTTAAMLAKQKYLEAWKAGKTARIAGRQQEVYCRTPSFRSTGQATVEITFDGDHWITEPPLYFDFVENPKIVRMAPDNAPYDTPVTIRFSGESLKLSQQVTQSGRRPLPCACFANLL
jgi:hypothetical protein